MAIDLSITLANCFHLISVRKAFKHYSTTARGYLFTCISCALRCKIWDQQLKFTFGVQRFVNYLRSPILMKSVNIALEKNIFLLVFFISFLSATVDVEGVKITLKIGEAEHTYVVKYKSRKLLKIQFLCKLMKLVFFNDEFNGVYQTIRLNDILKNSIFFYKFFQVNVSIFEYLFLNICENYTNYGSKAKYIPKYLITVYSTFPSPFHRVSLVAKNSPSLSSLASSVRTPHRVRYPASHNMEPLERRPVFAYFRCNRESKERYIVVPHFSLTTLLDGTWPTTPVDLSPRCTCPLPFENYENLRRAPRAFSRGALI